MDKMTVKEKSYWGDTPQHTIDFANETCARNRARMAAEEEARISAKNKKS